MAFLQFWLMVGWLPAAVFGAVVGIRVMEMHKPRLPPPELAGASAFVVGWALAPLTALLLIGLSVWTCARVARVLLTPQPPVPDLKPSRGRRHRDVLIGPDVSLGRAPRLTRRDAGDGGAPEK